MGRHQLLYMERQQAAGSRQAKKRQQAGVDKRARQAAAAAAAALVKPASASASASAGPVTGASSSYWQPVWERGLTGGRVLNQKLQNLSTIGDGGANASVSTVPVTNAH